MKFNVILIAILTICDSLGSTALYAQTGSRTFDVSSDAGVVWQFKSEDGAWGPIKVPYGGWRKQGFTCDAGDYKAFLTVPAFGAHQRLHLSFDAVNFGANVYAGPDDAHLKQIAAHINGWVPFSADLTSLARPGKRLLVVIHVDGRNKFRKNGRYTVAEGANWCPSIEDGIIRGIHLEAVPEVRIEDVFVKTSVSERVLQAQVRIVNNGPTNANCIVTGRLASDGPLRFRYPSLQNRSVSVPPGGAQIITLTAAWNLGRSSYWWPNVPYRRGYKAQLHHLDLSLLEGTQKIDDRITDFGFRQFEAKGASYYLNGIHCNLRGDNLQEANFGTDAYGVKPGFGPPSKSNPGWPKTVDNLQRLNYTVMRIHQIPATEYMLSVCDRMGLMLVEESPLRGSEGDEDFVAGHDSMVQMDRELVLRDRNHPSVVIWSAANEWAAPIKDTTAAIAQLDNTRVIIADGIGDIGAPYINMEHYVDGVGVLPKHGGAPRTDRPYGETEAVWPADNTLRGFAWMATGTVLRRLKGDADVRNYTLNNAWPNFVPGEGRETEILENAVKGMKDEKILPDIATPWTDPHILLIQTSFAPVAAYDIDFNIANASSDAEGNWPILLPKVEAGGNIVRKIAVFNDEFSNVDELLRWSVHAGSPSGQLVDGGDIPVSVPLGSYAVVPVRFQAPHRDGKICLSISVLKRGTVRFTENRIAFQVVTGPLYALQDGVYRIANRATGTFIRATDGNVLTPLVGWSDTDAADEKWQVTNLGYDYVTIANVQDGLVMDVLGGGMDDNVNVIQYHGRQADNQIWRVVPKSPQIFTLINKNSGKLLDLYGSQSQNGARIEQWSDNGGLNQQWTFERLP